MFTLEEEMGSQSIAVILEIQVLDKGDHKVAFAFLLIKFEQLMFHHD